MRGPAVQAREDPKEGWALEAYTELSLLQDRLVAKKRGVSHKKEAIEPFLEGLPISGHLIGTENSHNATSLDSCSTVRGVTCSDVERSDRPHGYHVVAALASHISLSLA